jgi:hypothetical protein
MSRDERLGVMVAGEGANINTGPNSLHHRPIEYLEHPLPVQPPATQHHGMRTAGSVLVLW